MLSIDYASHYNQDRLIIPVSLMLTEGWQRKVFMDDPAGPIEHFEWGQYRVMGKIHSAEGEGAGKDICLLKGEVRPWAARKGHRLTPDMVAVVFEQGVSTLVIGNGVRGRLKVTGKTRRAIQQAGIKKLIVETTPEACATYNRLFQSGESVALLAHGTC
ncbi:MAG TPA: hypothetical protein DF984_05790 [Anaerolineaceae bacterium]|nr:hypothetical protein [Anaerolineaceae bacterium]